MKLTADTALQLVRRYFTPGRAALSGPGWTAARALADEVENLRIELGKAHAVAVNPTILYEQGRTDERVLVAKYLESEECYALEACEVAEDIRAREHMRPKRNGKLLILKGATDGQ